MGQITLVVEKCGCYVQQDTHLEEKVSIVYCPKHKAAPDMYEALKGLLVALHSSRRRIGVNLEEKMTEGRLALAKAEGGK